MATEGQIISRSFPASADLSTKQYMAVALDTSGNLVVEDGDADPLGILLDKPAALARAGAVALTGSITKAQVSGTIVRGAYLAPSGNGTVSGYLIATTTDTDEYIAIALDADTADGTTAIIDVQVIRGNFAG